MTDQELQQISEDSNSIIVLLCEKVLRASDAGQIGRLVMPKACAEAYFHPISQPEGLPLRIQDVKGKEWVFQFRFWPNNTSRMYVLDGITPYIESIQLQVGDTVTFSCRDPKGKIVMGFRKASTSIAMQAAHPDLYPMVSHHHLPLSLPLRKKENIKHIQPEYWPPKLLLGFLLVVICLCTYFVEISCSIHEYNNENFVQKSNAFFFYGGSEGLYASKDHCDCRSFIRFEDVRFLRTKDSNSKANGTRNNTGLVETIIFDIKEREQIQGFFVKSKEICCSPDLAERGFCQLGQVIIKKKQDGAEWPKRFTTFFKWKNEEAKIDDITIDVERTGMYYLYFVICDPRLNNTLIRGRTVWRNQGGYLPGGMAPLVTFFGIMSLPYLLLGLFWLCRFVQHWKDIIPLHYCIAAVIALGLCEMALWFFVYANLNSRGRRPMGMTLLCAVSVTAVEKTLSRLLLLVVSSGSGVLRPTLSDITLRVLFLGCSYLFSSELYGLDMHWGIINDLPANSSLYLALPVTFVDVSFIMWIFISLAHTLDELQMRRNVIKLKLYTKFTIVFAVSTLLSIAWVAFQMAFELTDPPSEWWQIYWIIPAGWTILAYSLLVVVCMLWVPSHNPRRYAYLEETDDSTEEGIALTDMRR